MVIGGVVEFVPTALVRSNVPTIASVKPYTPLEVEGRDLYIREGCVGCHSQMVRPLRSETARYGDYSKAGEFVYDHPFLWGSKRTGPDLHRDRRQVSGRLALRPHEAAGARPRRARSCPATRGSTTPGSTPRTSRERSSRCGGWACPIPRASSARPRADLKAQASAIAAGLIRGGFDAPADREIVALIAYLQRLGTDIASRPAAADAGPALPAAGRTGGGQ